MADRSGRVFFLYLTPGCLHLYSSKCSVALLLKKYRFDQCVIIFTLWWFYRVYILHIWRKQACLFASNLFILILPHLHLNDVYCFWTFLECFSQYKNFTPPKYHHIAPKITNPKPGCMSNNAVPRTHTSYSGLHVYTFVLTHRTGINVSFLITSLARIKTWTCCGPES